MKTVKYNLKVNHQIRAGEVRVISSDGKQVGVMPLPEALTKAGKAKLDLIEIAPNANPPVVKIMELGKFLYEEEKKARREKKGVKGGELKEVRFSPFIGEHDYKTRVGRVKEFLDGKNKVRLVVVFKGREMGSKQFGYSLISKILAEFADAVVAEGEPKFFGRHLSLTISPTTKAKIANEINSDTKVTH